jgi:isoquinoline 1-oxidoreductase beta subunit
MSKQPLLIARRTFLAGLNVSAGGLALGFFTAQKPTNEPTGQAGPKPKTSSQAEEKASPGLNPNVFVHVAPDGLVTIVCHRSEMGQGIRSSLPVLIADELGADMARVKIVQADGDPAYGDQNTDGSNSVRSIYEEMRRVGATARVMLISAAARRWKVAPEQSEARDHVVIHRASCPSPSRRRSRCGPRPSSAAPVGRCRCWTGPPTSPEPRRSGPTSGSRACSSR